jgi:hypothetical protein
MQRDRDHDIDITEVFRSGHFASDHLSEILSGRCISFVFEIIQYMSISAFALKEEQG